MEIGRLAALTALAVFTVKTTTVINQWERTDQLLHSLGWEDNPLAEVLEVQGQVDQEWVEVEMPQVEEEVHASTVASKDTCQEIALQRVREEALVPQEEVEVEMMTIQEDLREGITKVVTGTTGDSLMLML